MTKVGGDLLGFRCTCSVHALWEKSRPKNSHFKRTIAELWLYSHESYFVCLFWFPGRHYQHGSFSTKIKHCQLCYKSSFKLLPSNLMGNINFRETLPSIYLWNPKSNLENNFPPKLNHVAVDFVAVLFHHSNSKVTIIACLEIL